MNASAQPAAKLIRFPRPKRRPRRLPGEEEAVALFDEALRLMRLEHAEREHGPRKGA